VDVRISLGGTSDDDEKGLASLFRWLGQDADVRRDAKVSIEPSPGQQGDMGGALDVLNVVLSNSIALGSLIVAVATWVGSRTSGTAVHIERNGVKVTVHDDSPETVRRVLDALDGRAERPHR
jgi:hypothetical protein